MPFNCESVSSGQIVSTKCLICCEDSDEKLVFVREKGRLSLTECAKLHGCVGLLEYLNSSPAQILVHDSCRKRFTVSFDVPNMVQQKK